MTDKSDVRAVARRRPKDENDQPLFLKKAYGMIENCPKEIGEIMKSYNTSTHIA